MPSEMLKSPREQLDYKFDWATHYLAEGETINTYTITADSGITVGAEVESAGVVAVWLSGGTDGTDYEVNCQITTSTGRTPDRSLQIKVRTR